MTNITPLGSGRASYIPMPTPVADAPEPATPATAAPTSPAPSTASDFPAIPGATGADASESPAPQDSTEPSGDGSGATTDGPDTAEPFDLSAFHAAFASFKQEVEDQRGKLTLDIGGLQAEAEQLEAQIADWDARATAAEQRQSAVKRELESKLTSFAQLDEATSHLEATDALLYPQPTAEA